MPDRIFPKINHKAATAEIGKFLKEEFRKRKKTSAIVGVSGGVDSSLTAELCQRAGLDVKRVFMPYGKTSKGPGEDFSKIDITKAVDILAGKAANKISKGNIMARVRMIILYDLAKKIMKLKTMPESERRELTAKLRSWVEQNHDLEKLAGKIVESFS